jgi:hypothetical protein
LFIKEKQAEEVKLMFPKAKAIKSFSFVFGDDFNFYVASNLNIDLYDIKFDKVKAKLVKNISISSHYIFSDPLSCTLISCDEFGRCSPILMNLYKQKQHRGKNFQLESGDKTNPENSVNNTNMPINQSMVTANSSH